MFVHAVYFWLHDNLSDMQRDTFQRGVASLATIDSVHQAFVGVPASTDRPIIDRTYSQALIVVFQNERDHDRYQVDPIHDRFREECSRFWRKVVIYDSIG
jgi:hypothetical protein